MANLIEEFYPNLESNTLLVVEISDLDVKSHTLFNERREGFNPMNDSVEELKNLVENLIEDSKCLSNSNKAIQKSELINDEIQSFRCVQKQVTVPEDGGNVSIQIKTDSNETYLEEMTDIEISNPSEMNSVSYNDSDIQMVVDVNSSSDYLEVELTDKNTEETHVEVLKIKSDCEEDKEEQDKEEDAEEVKIGQIPDELIEYIRTD